MGINEAQTRDLGDGWLYFYNSVEFLETGSNLSRLAGNGPIFVLRSGSVYFLPSYQAIEASLAEVRENPDRFLRHI